MISGRRGGGGVEFLSIFRSSPTRLLQHGPNLVICGVVMINELCLKLPLIAIFPVRSLNK